MLITIIHRRPYQPAVIRFELEFPIVWRSGPYFVVLTRFTVRCRQQVSTKLILLRLANISSSVEEAPINDSSAHAPPIPPIRAADPADPSNGMN